MLNLTHGDIYAKAITLARRIEMHFDNDSQINVYAVPRGGIPVAYLLCGLIPRMVIVQSAEDAHCIVDDLIDSGATMHRYDGDFGVPFFALINKNTDPGMNRWLVFPWEVTEQKDESFTDNVVRLLQFVGEDPNRGGLLETPARVARAWQDWCSGYKLNAKDILKVFEDGAEGCDEMITVCKIPVHSHCEHHLAAIFGTATVSYIPNGKIVGLSKINRLVDMFARRLQVQERLTNQIADALQEHLNPKGVGVMIDARHFCIESRGVGHAGCNTVTTALRGVFKTDPSARGEFLASVKGA